MLEDEFCKFILREIDYSLH